VEARVGVVRGFVLRDVVACVLDERDVDDRVLDEREADDRVADERDPDEREVGFRVLGVFDLFGRGFSGLSPSRGCSLSDIDSEPVIDEGRDARRAERRDHE
jgi:hypothetical protein